MLMQTSEEVLEKFNHVENTRFLLDTVISNMEGGDLLVNLEFFKSRRPCGTYRCLAGWYAHYKNAILDREWLDGHAVFNSADKEFGVDFGMYWFGQF